MIELVLGGTRSGKSQYAEAMALHSGLSVTYIATARAGVDDTEMDARIARHRERRPADWQVVEAPRDLATSLEGLASPRHFLLVDCLTLWLTNLLDEENPLPWQRERAALLSVLPKLSGSIV
ncbi:MAG: bifunctional adenosylcobinamide kinase/adenosylcobinamide-phosphate guanylyltransferase, partial [Magnetococcales bacterium]|nr:bifunctional adenosylcobinamide kinase/adenosylcobinamide-phosphate guanylyltransferase [Magnetococcales bacterium]